MQLKLEIDGDRIVSVRGDEDDPFSQGYICPKGVAVMPASLSAISRELEIAMRWV